MLDLPMTLPEARDLFYMLLDKAGVTDLAFLTDERLTEGFETFDYYWMHQARRKGVWKKELLK